MAYTAWHDFTAGETLTASLMDALVANLQALFPVGAYCYMARAATTSETLVNGVWLECNAVSVLRATYPDLNTLLAGLSYPFGTVDGTHMTLPDAQGRTLVSMASGGHTDVNGLGDSDGIAKASRTPKGTVSFSGNTGAGSAHSHGAGTYTVTTTSVVSTAGPAQAAAHAAYNVAGSSASESSHTHSFSGGGTEPGNYVVGGTLFIKAVA